jgi:hypothetical protein
MRAEHEGEARRDASPFAADGIVRCLSSRRASARTVLVEQVEIELLKLEREEVAAACADGARLALAMQPDRTGGKRASACLDERIARWRERVRGLLFALQSEGLAVPSVLAQAFGGATSAWPSAADLARAACAWSPSEEHRVLCARALQVQGDADAARAWLRTVRPAVRPRDLASALDVDAPARERAATGSFDDVHRSEGMP